MEEAHGDDESGVQEHETNIFIHTTGGPFEAEQTPQMKGNLGFAPEINENLGISPDVKENLRLDFAVDHHPIRIIGFSLCLLSTSIILAMCCSYSRNRNNTRQKQSKKGKSSSVDEEQNEVIYCRGTWV